MLDDAPSSAEPEAPHALDGRLRALIDELGERAVRTPRSRAWWRFAWWLDKRVRTTSPEILDGDGVTPARRDAAMRGLARLNDRSGAHLTWSREILERLPPSGARSRSTHVYELAAGTGDFARALHQAATDTGRALHVTISDLDEAVLRGPSEQERGWLAVARCDATRLGTLAGVDLVLCVQAAHHLTPSQLVRLLGNAAREAPRVLIIDVYRAANHVLVAGLGALLFGRDRIVILDGMRSIRRGYTPVELLLLASIAAPDRPDARAEGIAPAYTLLDLGPVPQSGVADSIS